MSVELQELQKELWKTYQVVKSINSIAEARALEEEEKDKLQFLIKQIRSIQAEIKEEKSKAEEPKAEKSTVEESNEEKSTAEDSD